MITARTSGLPFAPGAVWPVWPQPAPPNPVELRVEAQTVTARTDPARLGDEVRLRLVTASLDDGVDRKLAELLLTVPGVRPDECEIDPNGSVDVRVVEPTTVTDNRVVWQVTAELAVVHTDSGGCLSLDATESAPSVDLTHTECRRLVTALVSMRHWRLVLVDASTAEATAKRRGLQRARAVRGFARR